MNNKNIILSSLVAVVILIIGVLFFFKPQLALGNLEEFAKCLSEKGVTMYGADWCPHCQSEKKAFGASFKYVPYVECPKNPKLCLEKGIEGYPTWILPNGTKLIGERGLEKLSAITNCPLVK